MPAFFYCPHLLTEFEQDRLGCAVNELQLQGSTSVCPGFVCLPDVGVLSRGCIIGKAGIARSDSCLHRIHRAACAGGKLDPGIASCKDVQSLIPSEAELDRHSLPGL